MFELLRRSAGFAAAFTVGEHTIAGAKMKLSAALKAIQSTSILSRWSQGNQLLNTAGQRTSLAWLRRGGIIENESAMSVVTTLYNSHFFRQEGLAGA